MTPNTSPKLRTGVLSTELRGHRAAASEARLGGSASAVAVGLAGGSEKTTAISLTSAFASLATTLTFFGRWGGPGHGAASPTLEYRFLGRGLAVRVGDG